ncbi:MAG: DUF4340 domain-containing protein [Sandaracinaceae bacterium]|nr:DUF4340 domain-containing protein [Sandaracinaceae bacterium]
MTRKTTIALAIANALLLVFILVYERGTVSTGERAARSGQVLRSFVRDRVDRVELVRGEEPALVFERERPADDDVLAVGTWTIREPMAVAADEDAVDGLLGALEWLAARRTFDGVGAEDRARFGLDAPRFVVRFRVRDERVELRVGGPAPTGEGVYVAIEGEDRAYVVEQDFVESIDHDLAHFRDKRLFRGFYPTGVERVEVGEHRFERAGGMWLVRAPVRGWANQGLVDGVVRITRELSATRFVAEPGELSRYGLDAPWRELVVSRGADVTEQRVARLRVGGPCGEHDAERYAVAGDSGPVVCVRESDVEALVLDPERVRETRLLPVTDDAIDAIVVTRGEARVEVRREGDQWKLRIGQGAATQRADADDGAVGAWLAALRDRRAVEIVEIAELPAGATDAAALVTLRVERRDEPALELRVTASDAEGVWLRRGDEEARVRFEASAFADLDVGPLRFRARQIFAGDPADAVRVSLSRGAREERAVRGEDAEWRLEAPIEAEADRVVVREIARQLATLRAERFVAQSASVEHGLAAPFARVRVELRPREGEPRELALDLGAPTEDGRFARAGEAGVVFVIASDRAQALTRELVGLDLLAVDADALESLRLERGEEVVELRREGTGWQLAGGGTPNEARTRALLERLATLRASAVSSYGPPGDAAAVRVVATRRASAEGERVVTLAFGEPVGSGDDAYLPAWREGLAVVYRVRPDAVRSALDYRP